MACKVCEHPKRAEIEAALAASGDDLPIADRFGVARAVLKKHRAHLMTAPAPSPAEAATEPPADVPPPPASTPRAKAPAAPPADEPLATSLDAIEELLPLARRRAKEALEDADTSWAARSQFLDALRKLEADRVKLRGEGARVDITQHPDFIELTAAFGEILAGELADQPGKLRRIVAKLQEREQQILAERRAAA